MVQKFEILQENGAFFKITMNTNGEEQKREVVRCECGDYISKKTLRNHVRSKKHQQWILQQFDPLYKLTKYRDILVSIKNLEEEKAKLELQFKWGEEEEQMVAGLPIEDEQKETFLSLKPAVQGKVGLDELDVLLSKVLNGLKTKKTPTKKKPQSKAPIEPESIKEKAPDLVEEDSAPPVPVEEIPIVHHRSSKNYGVAKHPDSQNLPNIYLIFKPHSFEENKKDMKAFFKSYGFDLDQENLVIDVSDITLKQQFYNVGAYWDKYREKQFFDKNWLPEDDDYFDKHWKVRNLTLVKSVAMLFCPLREGETPEERVNNLMDGETKYSQTSKFSHLYFWDQEKNQLFSSNDIIFPITMSQEDHNRPFGRCQECHKFVGDYSCLPCRHSICDECYQSRKRRGNCVLKCMVCDLRFRDYWEIFLESDEEADEEGNIWKNGKKIRPYWKRIKT